MALNIAKITRKIFSLSLAWSVLLLAACGGGGGGGGTAATASYSIGGTVTGLTGTVVLQNNLGDDLTVSANGNFTFATMIADTAAYSVSVLTQPAGQTCTVSTGAGTVPANNVTNVAVVCAFNAYSVGGSVSALAGTLILQNNGGDNITIAVNGSFTFATPVAYGSTYSVTVLSQPSSQACSISSGSGTMGTANVTDVAVTCYSSGIPSAPVAGCVPDGLPDLPDDLFADTNCDGIDGDISASIFVSPLGNDSSPGTISEPKLTINAAVAAASAAGKIPVYVAAGTYGERLQLVSGVSIYGGFALNWSRSASNIAKITGAASGGNYFGIQGGSIGTSTVVDRITVDTTAPIGAYSSNYGLYCNSCIALVLKNSNITTGKGANGTAGNNGILNTASVTNSGGPGGSAGYNTGAGGAGSTGSGPLGVGGTGGAGGTSSSPSGKAGGAGNSPNGTNGIGGFGGNTASNFWLGNAGTSGTDGMPGGGGGGGGGSYGPVFSYGYAGGLGGAGGQPGFAATGGAAGGGSFGLFAISSTGLILQNNTIGSGVGGAGGSGGVGGTGSAGQAGATCAGAGCDGGTGGNGGAGGNGGGGGGGAGGPSYGLYRLNTTVSTAGNTVNGNAGGAGGLGGGGATSGTAGANGTIY